MQNRSKVRIFQGDTELNLEHQGGLVPLGSLLATGLYETLHACDAHTTATFSQSNYQHKCVAKCCSCDIIVVNERDATPLVDNTNAHSISLTRTL